MSRVLVALAVCCSAATARADTARTLPAGTWKADVRYIAVAGGPIRLHQALVVPGELLGSLGLTAGGGGATRPDDLPLGELDLELTFRAQVLAPGLSHGITDWLSVGFAVPVFLDAAVHVRRFDYAGDWGYNPEFPADRSRSLLLPAFDARAVTGAAGLQRALVEAFEYEPIQDVHTSGLGDMVLGARARLWQKPRTVAAVQPELLLPTGATDDPDNLIDFGLGDGHVDLGATLLVDFALARGTALGMFAGATHSFPHLMTARVYQDPSFPLASRTPWPAPYTFVGSQRTVERDPGDTLSIGAGLAHELDERWQLTARYGFRASGADQFSDGGSRLPALEAGTERRVHTAGGGLRYTLVDSYLRGRAPAPLEVDLDLARTFSATPEAAMTIVTATATVFFGEPAARLRRR
jgi:hypothetical protein